MFTSSFLLLSTTDHLWLQIWTVPSIFFASFTTRDCGRWTKVHVWINVWLHCQHNRMCCSLVSPWPHFFIHGIGLLLLALLFPTDAVQRTEEGGDNQIKNTTNLISADVLFMWVGCIGDDCAARDVKSNLRWSFVAPTCIPVRIDSCSIHRDCLCLFFFPPHNTRINFAHVSRHLFNSVLFVSHVCTVRNGVCLYYTKRRKRTHGSHRGRVGYNVCKSTVI